MRAWWRHWHVSPSDEPQHINPNEQQQQQQQQQGEALASQPPTQQQQQQQQQQQPLQQQPSLHGKERELEVQVMMAAGWEAVVLHDWSVSLQHLCNIWQAGPPWLAAAAAGSSSSSSISSLGSSSASSSRNNAEGTVAMDVDTADSSSSSSNVKSFGTSTSNTHDAAAATVAQAADKLEYDGVLGFSNGAAAAFLFVAHAAAHPERFSSLRFVMLAGGYVPEPLEKLLPQQMLKQPPPPAAGADSSSSSEVAPCDRLSCKLPFSSLHMMGENDPLMDVADSSQLMECFQEHGRWGWQS
jgi:hypothetical protein